MFSFSWLNNQQKTLMKEECIVACPTSVIEQGMCNCLSQKVTNKKMLKSLKQLKKGKVKKYKFN